MHIVRASVEDLADLVPLFDAYRQFYRQPSNLRLAESFLRARLGDGDSEIFVARADTTGQALGFVQLFPSFSSVSAQRVWILNDLFVAAGARSDGVGRALMERARDHAVETSAKGLLLSTQIDNRIAQSLYEDLGYVRDEHFYSYFLPI